MKMKLRNPLTQLENSKGSSTSRRKVECLNQIKIKTQEKGIQEIRGITYKPNLQIIEYVSSLNKGKIYSYRCKTPNRQDQKENIHGPSMENKKHVWKTRRRETQVTYNRKSTSWFLSRHSERQTSLEQCIPGSKRLLQPA